MKIFNETVNVEEDKITITITCEKRQHVREPKVLYKNNVESLIPEELRKRVKLLSLPDEKLSNMNIEGHTQTATWVYLIEKPEVKPKEEKVQTKRPTRRRTRTTKKSS